MRDTVPTFKEMFKEVKRGKVSAPTFLAILLPVASITFLTLLWLGII